MTGAAFEVTFDDAMIRGAMDRLEAVIMSPTGLLSVIGAYGRDSTVRRFATQAGPDGKAWAPLNRAYASLKPSGYDILYLHGDLMNSQTFRVGEGAVSWGSPMIYAAVHQFGAVIVPKNAKALYFKLGLGGVHEVMVQSVTIPARPYLGLSVEDMAEIPLLAEEYLLRQLGGG